MPIQGVLGTTDVRRNPSRQVRREIEKESGNRGGVSTRSGASTRGSSQPASRQAGRPAGQQRVFREPTTSEENSSSNGGRIGAASAADRMSSDRDIPSSQSSPAEPLAPLRIGGSSTRATSVPARRSNARHDPGAVES
eukprot:GHVU01103738.1.p1 GENE.GHVU01103738.1~~GHVU01103738.1.p1  ORF type:complete len:138 (+),score=11.83 GHVU01103738.1:527-940(+)